MACISSSTISILWNGKASIRQGNPLSPYVFILCLNQLSLTLDQALHSKQLKPIRVGRHPILFNHVLFAYDIFLFSHATIPDCNTLLNIFRNFYNILGQVCSKEKKKNLLFQEHTSTDATNHCHSSSKANSYRLRKIFRDASAYD